MMMADKTLINSLLLVSSPLQRRHADPLLCCPQVATKHNNKYFYIPAAAASNIFSSEVNTSTLLNLRTWHENVLSPMKYINKRYITINN